MRRFILSLGAQKAATSWFYLQMFRQRNFKRPACKEMHVLDAAYLSDELPFEKEIAGEVEEARQSNALEGGDRFLFHRRRMLSDRREYLRYYDRLLNEPNCFSCDVTPSYAGLPERALGFVRSGFADRGIRVSAVFVLREPVSRVESAIRMRLRNAGKLEAATTNDLMTLIRSEAGSPGDRIRSSYRRTVGRIFSEFERDEVFIGFYETLFERLELERLSLVTGLDPERFDASERVNHTEVRPRYPWWFIQEIRSVYEDEYAFAVDGLGLDQGKWDSRVDALLDC